MGKPPNVLRKYKGALSELYRAIKWFNPNSERLDQQENWNWMNEKIILSFISFMKRLDIDRSGLVLSEFFILMVQ